MSNLKYLWSNGSEELLTMDELVLQNSLNNPVIVVDDNTGTFYVAENAHDPLLWREQSAPDGLILDDHNLPIVSLTDVHNNPERWRDSGYAAFPSLNEQFTVPYTTHSNEGAEIDEILAAMSLDEEEAE